MSGVNEILLSDAKIALTNKVGSLSGLRNLDEAFAAWLLPGSELGLSIENAAHEAASHVGATRTYLDVAILGFAIDGGKISNDEKENLRSNLRWLSGSSPFINNSPAGVSLDPVAVLGVAIGSVKLDDPQVRESVSAWITSFISNSYKMRHIEPWRKCLFAAAQHVADARPILPVPNSRSIADVRVALRAKGLLPTGASATDDDRQVLLSLKSGVDLSLDVRRLALSLAAYNSVSGFTSSLLHESPDEQVLGRSRSEDSVMVKVLFLAANPRDQNQLNLTGEMAEIDRDVRTAQFRDVFRIVQQWEVRVTELQSHLMRHNPNIVHFSGHGSSSSEIILEDRNGKSHPVSVRALGNLFSALKDNIRCVVLNACFSENQAKAIAKHIECVVGMSRSISDQAAISFAAKFYQALAYGKSVQDAFNLGCVQTDMEGLDEQDTPKLLHAPDCDPSRVIFAPKS